MAPPMPSVSSSWCGLKKTAGGWAGGQAAAPGRGGGAPQPRRLVVLVRTEEGRRTVVRGADGGARRGVDGKTRHPATGGGLKHLAEGLLGGGLELGTTGGRRRTAA